MIKSSKSGVWSFRVSDQCLSYEIKVWQYSRCAAICHFLFCCVCHLWASSWRRDWDEEVIGQSIYDALQTTVETWNGTCALYLQLHTCCHANHNGTRQLLGLALQKVHFLPSCCCRRQKDTKYLLLHMAYMQACHIWCKSWEHTTQPEEILTSWSDWNINRSIWFCLRHPSVRFEACHSYHPSLGTVGDIPLRHSNLMQAPDLKQPSCQALAETCCFAASRWLPVWPAQYAQHIKMLVCTTKGGSFQQIKVRHGWSQYAPVQARSPIPAPVEELWATWAEGCWHSRISVP